MTRAPKPALKARKTPMQSRSRVTVDAIFEATIQVLLRDGMGALTTTRVAERAGVSVGTMYQYFPNKQALVYALNERYLDTLAGRIEAVCARMQGAPLAKMAEALVDAYWAAKTERAEVTRALYRSVVELDNDALLHAFAARADAATTAMFATACDGAVEDVDALNLTLASVIYGTVRNAFERGLTDSEARVLRGNLVAMCRAYICTFSG
ncbi:TetR/AcrR family transcriptional regulator [Pseudooceanicola sediminis]|uniref:TetR/AcrR family transcriptional regulator n=1 Tax=Pseudooceanicola sediminis TaxID=2211117 RepID=A0A399J4M6_9RHOB|nr:TetR/AcrR family transcriptional regulator [Pseudooceanicola sediminis]KAA2314675.1 TetR/AcrR family transcriptional regulator [Puniceibacterium sp. HSS470]RII39537.1 TetR/AcrR family transcriptional regulator [Pseudooceanicola sediminis]|tara:strand:- start:231202 stop:231831 length:630 start_codon:yes stop_codon:yes gene_type:complete